MIIQKKVKVIANSGIIRFYKNIITNIQRNKEYEIDVNQLIPTSHIKILVECDICHNQSMKQYRQYLESYNKRNLYCCSSICAQIKNKKTNIQKYGCENVFQNKNIQNKISDTNNKKYGKNWFTQTEQFKEKSKITNKKRYGTENVAQSELIKNKMKRTCLEKYGVKSPIQNIDVFNKQQKSSFRIKNFKNLHYQGTYELDFLNKYYSQITIENGMTIRYNLNKVYYPDFYIPNLNLIIEIKSDYTYNKDLDKNLLKQKACLEQGYNFIFIINKKYFEFEKIYLT